MCIINKVRDHVSSSEKNFKNPEKKYLELEEQFRGQGFTHGKSGFVVNRGAVNRGLITLLQ